MLNSHDILETINMIDNENLDVRTITMGISLFAQAFGLEWIETVFSVLISGAAKLCSMQFDPIILLRVLVTCGVWTVAAYVCGKKVLLKKDI